MSHSQTPFAFRFKGFKNMNSTIGRSYSKLIWFLWVCCDYKCSYVGTVASRSIMLVFNKNSKERLLAHSKFRIIQIPVVTKKNSKINGLFLSYIHFRFYLTFIPFFFIFLFYFSSHHLIYLSLLFYFSLYFFIFRVEGIVRKHVRYVSSNS